MKTKIISAIVFIITLVSLASCTEEEILPVNGKGKTTISNQVLPGQEVEIIYYY